MALLEIERGNRNLPLVSHHLANRFRSELKLIVALRGNVLMEFTLFKYFSGFFS